MANESSQWQKAIREYETAEAEFLAVDRRWREIAPGVLPEETALDMAANLETARRLLRTAKGHLAALGAR